MSTRSPKTLEVTPEAAEAPVAPPVALEQPEQLELFSFEPTIVEPTHKRARIKGTWTQFFGTQIYEFEDGKSYDLPLDMFEYLRQRGNIYDTLA